MSDERLDVCIAVYTSPELASEDLETYLRLVGTGLVKSEGVALVVKDADGGISIKETGDHAGSKGAKIGGGIGLAVGLLAPPLLAAAALGAAGGALVGQFAKQRVMAGIAETLDSAIPNDAAGVVMVYDHAHSRDVERALERAVSISSVQIDKTSASELKRGLDEAGAGLTD